MRTSVATWVLGVGVLAAGCSSGRRAPCGPICVTEVRRAPTCCPVTLPERVERRLAYRAIPAECRSRDMPEYGLCQRTTYEERVTPLTTAVEVPDYCTTLMPTCETGCVPVMGYRTVRDYEDRVEPICAPHRTPVFKTVPVPVQGCVCDPCGRGSYGTVGYVCESRPCGTECRMRKVGERLVQANVGEHLEQVPVSVAPVQILTGSRPARVLVGSHYEDVVVGQDVDYVVADRAVDYRRTGTRREQIVKRPCRLQAYEEEVRIPGERVWVCDDPRHAHAGRVITSAEYETLTGRRVP